jgi:hypothetical protein
MSEHAFRSRRATTTSDCMRAMRQQQSPDKAARSVGQIARSLPDLVACCERRQIARPTDGGAMSEHAFRSRRATTTSDCMRAMREQQSSDKLLRASGKSRSLPDLVACCERRQIARPTDGGVMSEHAFRSRRATTTSDCLRAMREQQSPDKAARSVGQIALPTRLGRMLRASGNPACVSEDVVNRK